MWTSDIWNGLGALLIATVLLATHPLRLGTAERITDQIAVSWNEMAQQQGCTTDTLSCMMLPLSLPLGQN